MNYKSSERETLIPSFLRPTIIIAHLYGKTIGLDGNNNAGLGEANIRVDINDNPLDYLSAMRQIYINWYSAVQSELRSLLEKKCFEITFLSPGFTVIGCRWVFKRKLKSKPIGDDISKHSLNENNIIKNVVKNGLEREIKNGPQRESQ